MTNYFLFFHHGGVSLTNINNLINTICISHREKLMNEKYCFQKNSTTIRSIPWRILRLLSLFIWTQFNSEYLWLWKRICILYITYEPWPQYEWNTSRMIWIGLRFFTNTDFYAGSNILLMTLVLLFVT